MNDLEVRLIRHATGEHMKDLSVIVGRASGARLTAEGKDEATAKGLELMNRGIVPDRLAASPAIRTVDTAWGIAHAAGMGLDLKLCADLVEMDQGDSVGLPRLSVYTDELLAQINEQGLDFALPGGESMNDVGRRGQRWLKLQQGLVESVQSIVAVSHKGLITNLVGDIEGWSQDKRLAMSGEVEPVSETLLVLSDEEWHVDYFARPLQD